MSLSDDPKKRGAGRGIFGAQQFGHCNGEITIYARSSSKGDYGQDVETWSQVGGKFAAHIEEFDQKDKNIGDFDSKVLRMKFGFWLDKTEFSSGIQADKHRITYAFIAYKIIEVKVNPNIDYVECVGETMLSDL